MQASSSLDTKHILSHYDPAVLQMHKALKTAEESGAGSEVVEAIKKALELVDARDEFCETLTSPESEPCKNIMDASYAHDWKTLKAEGKTKWNLTPRMLTGHLEGQFLKSMVSISNAKRILEIGMYTGYSALAMAEALPADGEVVTVDQEKYLESFTGDLVSKSPHGSKIKIHIGSAIDYMKKAAEAGEKFDLIFLDADKSEYWDYLTIAMNGGLLNARGTILVDNTFRHGAGYMKEAGENSTKQFAESCIADKSLHKCLVPMRDGVCMIRRVADVEGAPAK